MNLKLLKGVLRSKYMNPNFYIHCWVMGHWLSW